MYFTKADISHINRAIKIAEQSTMRQRHGAVLATGRRIFAVGVNTFRTDPNSTQDPKAYSSFHAEQNAIKQVDPDALKDMTLYVARINKSGDSMLSIPCIRCMSLIHELGIRECVYTTENNGIAGYIL